MQVNRKKDLHMKVLKVWVGWTVYTPWTSMLRILCFVDKIKVDCFKLDLIALNTHYLKYEILRENKIPNHLFIIANKLIYLNVKTNYLSYVLCTSVDGIIWKPEH